MQNHLTKLKQEYLEYLEIERGRSLKTVENYDLYLKRFLTYSKATKPEQITSDIVRHYRLWLNREPGTNGETMKKQTQNYHLIALRSFTICYKLRI